MSIVNELGAVEAQFFCRHAWLLYSMFPYRIDRLVSWAMAVMYQSDVLCYMFKQFHASLHANHNLSASLGTARISRDSEELHHLPCKIATSMMRLFFSSPSKLHCQYCFPSPALTQFTSVGSGIGH